MVLLKARFKGKISQDSHINIRMFLYANCYFIQLSNSHKTPNNSEITGVKVTYLLVCNIKTGIY